MPEGWEWDSTLFAGAAEYYDRGRLPYPDGLADALAGALDLDAPSTPRPRRLLDVGCGPGTVARRVAHRFDEVVGLDPDAGMLEEAARLAAEAGIDNARWVQARAEDLPAGLGTFRAATFAQSFHWMDRDVVARAVRDMLEPGGACVHVDVRLHPHTLPDAEMQALVERYLGPERRAGQGVLRHGTQSGEAEVLARAGFGPPEQVPVPGGAPIERSVDDVLAGYLSHSWSAPHLFGNRLQAFVRDARAVLSERSPSGRFVQQVPDLVLFVYKASCTPISG